MIDSKRKKNLDTQYDLGIVDRVFSVYLSAFMILSYKGWQIEVLPIFTSIIITIVITIIIMTIAINAKKTGIKFFFYISSVISSIIGVLFIINASGHDINLHLNKELLALPIGIVVWIITREVSLFVLKLLKTKIQ